MSFQWDAPMAKSKAQKSNDPSAAEVVAAGGVELQAVICKLTTMADGGLRLNVDLPELDPAMFALLYALRNKAVKITIR